VTTRGATTFSATRCDPTALGVTITLLTNLPLCGSSRTTLVTRAGATELSPDESTAPIPMHHITAKQKRVKLFDSCA
jgi:hypothetical protein